jgi:uncharacterized repeat protein (TIGR01451 family)
VIQGGFGDDTIVGAGGNDTVQGEDGVSTIGWNDGDGSEMISANGGASFVQVNGAAGAGDNFNLSDLGNGHVSLTRSAPTAATLDIFGAGTLIVNGIAGNDTFTVLPLTTILGVGSIRLNGDVGNDTFDVAPSTIFPIDVSGAAPATLPGDTLSVNFTGTTNPTLTPSGTGSGTWSFGNRQPVNFTGIETETIVDLVVTNSDAPDPVFAGANITYTITLTNNSSSAATNVTLSDTPSSSTFVSLMQNSGPAFTLTMPPVGSTSAATAFIASFPAGATATFTLVLRANSNLNSGATITNTATATAATSDVNPANNSGTTTTSVLRSADLSITKVGAPDPVNAGANITYTIVVTNNGPSDAQGPLIADIPPSGTTFVSLTVPPGWIPGTPPPGGFGVVQARAPTLASGASATFTLVLSVGSFMENPISNTVSVSANTADPNSANNSVTVTNGVTTSADLSITKSDSPDPVAAGANITYTIVATNAGPSDARTVTVSDTIPSNTTLISMTGPPGWTITGGGTAQARTSRLQPGTATFTLVVRTNSDLAAGSTITNTATIFTVTTDPNAANNSATATTGVIISSDVAVSKSDSPDPIPPGGLLIYSIQISNGPSDAQNLSFSDALPPNTTFASASFPPDWTVTTPLVGSTGTVTATAPFMRGGDVFVAFIRVDVSTAATPGSTLTNTATLSTTSTDPAPANNTSTATTTIGSPVADLRVQKSGAATVVPGANVIYTIDITNLGPSDASSVSLSDAVPANTTFVSLTAPAGWSATTPAAGATGTITATNPLVPRGVTATFTVVVNVGSSTPAATTISNTATVSSATADSNAANNSATASTTVLAADIAVTKSAPSSAAAAANLTYTVAVANSGNSVASAVVLDDSVPANTTFVSLAAPAGWTCTTPAAGATGNIHCTVAALAAGASASFSIVVSVNAATPVGTIITNTASATTTSPEPVTGNNSATATSTVSIGTVDLAVAIRADFTVVRIGSAVTYTITVTNNGPAPAVGVTVSDTLPAGSTFTSVTPSQGTCSGTATVTCAIGTLANGASATIVVVVKAPSSPATMTNTVTVSSTNVETNAANNTASVTVLVLFDIPALDPRVLMLLAVALAALGALMLRR